MTLSRSVRNYIGRKFNVIDVWDVLPYRWRHYYWDHIKPFLKPRNTRFRKVIPKTWCDVSSLVENINFEFIKGFYEDEYINGFVNWDAHPIHREFADWLEASYRYITEERPALNKQMEDAYPPLPPLEEMFVPCETDKEGKVKMLKMVDDGRTYEEKYGEVNRIEQLIVDKDTEILVEFVKRRQYFWT